MKKSRTWIFLGLILFFSIPILIYTINPTNFCSYKQNLDITNYTISSEAKIVTNITLILNYQDGKNVTFYNLTLIGDITPFNATIVAIGENNISYYEAFNGVFVKGLYINGTWYMNGNGNRNWLYYVNGQLAGVSCSKLELKNDSIVEWIFKGGNPFDKNNKITGLFWLCTGLAIGIVAACGIGIYFIARRGI